MSLKFKLPDVDEMPSAVNIIDDWRRNAHAQLMKNLPTNNDHADWQPKGI